MIEYFLFKQHVKTHPDKAMIRNFKDVLSLSEDKNLMFSDFEKIIILDSEIKNSMNGSDEFRYFTKPIRDEYSPYILLEGELFRPVQGIKTKEEYSYYSIINGSPVKLPNYKTLEVMLAEKGKILDDIKLVEPIDFLDIVMYDNGNLDAPMAIDASSLPFGIPAGSALADKFNSGTPDPNNPNGAAAGGGGGGGGGAPNKEEEWKPDMSLQSIAEQYAALAVTAAGAEELAGAAIAQMQSVMDVAIADAEAAEAASAASEAASQAAIATASAAQAASEAATAASTAALAALGL